MAAAYRGGPRGGSGVQSPGGPWPPKPQWEPTPKWIFWRPAWRIQRFAGAWGLDDRWEYCTKRQLAREFLRTSFDTSETQGGGVLGGRRARR